MMSSEEEADCFVAYGDRLSKKSKRSRQRVDAGEPRNSYSSIPNFSSRPSFLGGGLYSALFSQNHRHPGLLGRSFGPPSEMLNELLGRKRQEGEEASGASDSPPPVDAAHHMLRDILQGKKKELLALEQELRAVSVASQGDPPSPENNNTINNNNNELKSAALLNGTELPHPVDLKPVVENGVVVENGNSGDENNGAEEDLSEDGKGRREVATEDENPNRASDSEQSVGSPVSDLKIKEEPDEQGKDSAHKTERRDLKRARVENIVSSMRASPSLPAQVNGCKKRKLYHPQQHDAERYSNNSANMNINLYTDDETIDNNSDNEIRQKKVEKDALKSQLRTMQEQLAEMQQKYVQLCTRMDQDSECPDGEDASSGLELDNNSLSLPDKPMKSSPATTPVKDVPVVTSAQSQPAPVTVSPTVPKITSSKLQNPLTGGPQLPVGPGFNGALSLLQQQVLQEHGAPHHHHPQVSHHALSSAAAMYHKLFLEQEAGRLGKETADMHHHQVMGQQSQPPQHNSLPQPPVQPPQSAVPPNNTQQSPTQPAPKSDFSDRLALLRNNMAPVSGSDLEGLADVLKTEITSSVGNLIDSIMSKFVQQKRFLGKQSDVVAEQLNKDILLASQLLDRKSPRTKVIDRGNGGSERSCGLSNGVAPSAVPSRLNGSVFPGLGVAPVHQNNTSGNAGSNSTNNNNNPENNINTMNLPQVRPSPNAGLFQPPKPPTTVSSSSAALYSSIGQVQSHGNPFCVNEGREGAPEQNEALSLVVVPKKKRHKVTDTRITPRTVSRILAQDGQSRGPEEERKFGSGAGTSVGAESPPRPYHPPPPPILPVSLPTSVAIPNPGLHESQVFSPYSPFYHSQVVSNSPEMRDSPPPLPHPPSLLHPALLVAAQHASQDYSTLRVNSAIASTPDNLDRSSDCNSGEGPYDGITPTISFSLDTK